MSLFLMVFFLLHGKYRFFFYFNYYVQLTNVEFVGFTIEKQLTGRLCDGL